MPSFSHPPEVIQKLCQRIHAGESKSELEAETGISRTTILKHYRRWVKGSKPSSTIATGQAVDPARLLGLPHQGEIKTIEEGKSIVLAVPDLHCPFQAIDSIPFLQEVENRFKPNKIVFLGDEADFAAFSTYDHDPDGLSPGKELEKAIEALIPFYREFPEAFVCESNHTVRPMKRAFTAGLPAAFLPTYSTLLKAPDGWKWAQSWNIDGVKYHHGDSGRTGQFAPAAYLKAFKQSHCHGHLHSHASVMFEGPYFGVNAGCLIDPQAYAFKYARNHPIHVNLGCAVIFNGVSAIFQPLHTDQHGRWTGHL